MWKKNMETKKRNIKQERWIQEKITENVRKREFGPCFVERGIDRGSLASENTIGIF